MDWRTRLNNLVVGAALTDWLLMIFTAALTVVGVLQWREMHAGGLDTHTLADAATRQAEAAQRQSFAAKEQADIAFKNFALAFQPAVVADQPILVQKSAGAHVIYHIHNAGNGVAQNAVWEARTFEGRRLVKAATASRDQIIPGEFLPQEIGITAPSISIFDDSTTLSLEVRIKYDGGVSSNPRCMKFDYDPASRLFSPDIGCMTDTHVKTMPAR